MRPLDYCVVTLLAGGASVLVGCPQALTDYVVVEDAGVAEGGDATPGADAANDGASGSDGCTSMSSDPDNCGGSGVVCSGQNVKTRACCGGVCSGTCTSSFADCNGDLRGDGCETSTTTTLNCSGCGLACNTTNNTARSCNGTTCIYTCSAGRADCNAGTAPDTDGCECALPACGGNGCGGSTACATVAHSNGLTSSSAYYDCTPTGTFTNAQAHEACTAYAITQGRDSTACLDFGACSGGAPTVCYSTPQGSSNVCTNYCWGYTAGKDAGWVASCSCPNAQVGTWN